MLEELMMQDDVLKDRLCSRYSVQGEDRGRAARMDGGCQLRNWFSNDDDDTSTGLPPAREWGPKRGLTNVIVRLFTHEMYVVGDLVNLLLKLIAGIGGKWTESGFGLSTAKIWLCMTRSSRLKIWGT